jgi:uncharacterized protein (DUF983 family)
MARGESPKRTKGQPAIVRAALFGSCPRCGARTLFEAPARVALECSACGEDLASLERGGRLIGLVTALVAILFMFVALGFDKAFAPPLWLQAMIFAPLTIIGVIFALRLFKTVLLYAAYERREIPRP